MAITGFTLRTRKQIRKDCMALARKGSPFRRRLTWVFTWLHLPVLVVMVAKIYNVDEKSCIDHHRLSTPFNISSYTHHFVNPIDSHVLEGVESNSRPVARSSDVYHSKTWRPTVVHYVWCGGDFKFKHYLSVMSSFKILKPSQIVFHHTDTISTDSSGYYQYFGSILRDIPIVTLSWSNDIPCNDDRVKILQWILGIINKSGGSYIDNDVILTSTPHCFGKSKTCFLLDSELRGVIQISRNALDSILRTDNGLIKETKTHGLAGCVGEENYTRSESVCIRLIKDIYPKDVFELDTDFGKHARWLTYGKTEQLLPKQNDVMVVPLIVHYAWFGERELNYFGLLSILSCLYILEVDAVYVHGDYEPRGVHWARVKNHPRVKFKYREYPGAIFGNSLQTFLSHGSDVLRMDVLLRFGGIYIDWDVIWVNKIPDRLRRYDFVACYDWTDTSPFPNVFNFGVIMSRPGSNYTKFSLESYRYFVDKHWSFSPVHTPYKVYEQHPEDLFVERHLQVICANRKCHPIWLDGYQNEDNSHENVLKFDWTTDALSIHVTFPDPEEYESESALLASNRGIFSKIGKRVLRAAGINTGI